MKTSWRCLLLLTAGVLCAAPTAPPQAAAAPRIDPRAVGALERMNAFLKTVDAFEVTSRASVEEVVDDDTGAKLTFDMNNTYRVRRPDAFYVEISGDHQARQYYYDGRTFTVSMPRRNFYAQAPAPGTIRDTVAAAYRDFGIALPLADLFYWGGKESPSRGVTSAVSVGLTTIDGVQTDHYAFRGEGLEWQIWIQRGAEPLPRKVTITTLDDPARPSYSAVLTWNTRPTFAADTFRFAAPAGARPITLAQIGK
jgi:hypothetical protein